MRLRITFSKTELMRYTSHLDLHRAWERTFRRANLPLAYSQGFKPHPRLNLASALPLGFTSQAEVLDVWLENEMDLDEIKRNLKPALPPGLNTRSIKQVNSRVPSLQSQLIAAEYLVTLFDHHPNLNTNLIQILSAQSLPRERRGKQYDLRPLIHELQSIENDPDGKQRIRMLLSAQEGATGRPEEVLLSASIDPLATRIHRTRLMFAGK
ncbi:MAG: DUF2344 domain-containing protein [Anaerolineales bacterium]|nr:MAG: DUF2344 domain-containing protein [Anaerolineales bacterium]